ncbi:hypothetical protein BC937DRAFT_92863 [Endogone sp. FLAS-F59071]|nr:hypothetical protein BC937DRAFT_92863 [Endogone sp. FLAS-F59071]|eukprot:RUS15127.1 hypothetical protein BC937DRAFT_92863 [Endogone sp. FLAS-F59071]
MTSPGGAVAGKTNHTYVQFSRDVENPLLKTLMTKTVHSQTPAAVQRLRELRSGPDPRILRVGVKAKGCSGNSYILELAEKKGKFDEVVQQEDVTVLVDSKALLTVLGSEMDYVEGRLSSQFVFNNPNVKGVCGCGESFAL